MYDDIGVVALNNNAALKENFKNKTDSTLKVMHDYEKVDSNYEWLDIMEGTIRYIEEFLKNPNRLIVNEEDIVKVELAKKVTVESIRHLAKHTNLIRNINEKGEVIPSKILNIYKEESFNTYENRLVYTLILNMRDYLDLKKRNNSLIGGLKEHKKIEYTGSTKVGDERVNVNLQMETNLDTKEGSKKMAELQTRIKKLEVDISILGNMEVPKTLKKLNVARVTPPIKKTNVILKNVNFQYIMKLYDYLNAHMDEEKAKTAKKRNYEDNGELKGYIDDTFFLDYLALNTITKRNQKNNNASASSVAELTDKLISKILEINKGVSERELLDTIATRISKEHGSSQASFREIENIIGSNINRYLQAVENLKL